MPNCDLIFKKHIELNKHGKPLKDWEISLRSKVQKEADARRLRLAYLIVGNYHDEEKLPYLLHAFDNEGYLSNSDCLILGKPIHKDNEYWDSLPDYGVTKIISYNQFFPETELL